MTRFCILRQRFSGQLEAIPEVFLKDYGASKWEHLDTLDALDRANALARFEILSIRTPYKDN